LSALKKGSKKLVAYRREKRNRLVDARLEFRDKVNGGEGKCRSILRSATIYREKDRENKRTKNSKNSLRQQYANKKIHKKALVVAAYHRRRTHTRKDNKKRLTTCDYHQSKMLRTMGDWAGKVCRSVRLAIVGGGRRRERDSSEKKKERNRKEEETQKIKEDLSFAYQHE